jgi:hypothetical protein
MRHLAALVVASCVAAAGCARNDPEPPLTDAWALHRTDGARTGMKWLADKRDCLTVAFGEGYCRD